MAQVFVGFSWSGWTPIAGGMSGTPGFGINPDGRLEVFVATSTGTLFHQWQTSPGGSWSLGVLPLGAGFSGSNLAVGRNADGRLEVFSARLDGVVVHTWQQSGGWSGVASLGSAAAPISIQVDADGRLELFAPFGRTHDWQTVPSGGWSGWQSLP
jgi:hypothetical protein